MYIMSLDNCLYQIMEKRIEKIEIFDYTEFFLNGWDCLDVKLQNQITDVLATLKFEDFKENVTDVVRIMIDKIYAFPLLQKQIYEYLVQMINESKGKIGRYGVNYLGCLYGLENKNYYTKEQILKDITIDIRGKMPEIDWDWFESRDYDVIKRLIQRQGIKLVKKFFCKNEIDESIICKFLLNQLSEEKIEFVD